MKAQISLAITRSERSTSMWYVLRPILVLAGLSCVLLPSIIFPVSASAHSRTSSSPRQQTLATQTPLLACGDKTKKTFKDGGITAQTCFRQLSISSLLTTRIKAVNTLSFASNLFYEWQSCTISTTITEADNSTFDGYTYEQDCLQAARNGKTQTYQSPNEWFGFSTSPGYTYGAITTITYQYSLNPHPAKQTLTTISASLLTPSADLPL